MRIVSTVPSQTELLHYLGLEQAVVGITKFCIHPEDWFRNKQRIGGTKQLNIPLIQSLQPDLLIANKEENTQSDIEACAAFTNIYVSNVPDLSAALQMITDVGKLTNTSTESSALVLSIAEKFSQIVPHPARVAYLIWNNPMMTIGGDTFIHDMLDKMGWHNVFGAKRRYPTIDIDMLQTADLDYLLLSSEPYPFKDSHVAYFQALLPNTKILLVDGTYFSWYGSRLLEAPAYFQSLMRQVSS